MNETAALTTLSNDWRAKDALDAIKHQHQFHARNLNMDGHVGDVILPEAFIDVLEAARDTLDVAPESWPMLAEHLDALLAGLEYNKDLWEQKGHLLLLPYQDGFDSPHAMAFSVLCAPTRVDAGNKKKTRQRKRSQAVAITTKGHK
jgi:hypothetical protein